VPSAYYNQPVRKRQKKDNILHNLGEMALDPATWGTAIGAKMGGPVGAGIGKAVGDAIPFGVDLGPEDDDNFRSSLEGGLGEVAGDFVEGVGRQQAGQFVRDEVGGMFADPTAAEGAVTTASTMAGNPEMLADYTDQFMNVGSDALQPEVITATLGQPAANAPTTAAMDPNKLSTLEKAFMINSIVQTGFNMAGDLQDRRRYEQSRGPGNMFDTAMTDAFDQDRRNQGVRTYQNYINRVG